MKTHIGAFKINKNTERADQAQFNSTYYVRPNVSQPSSQDKKSGSLLPKEIQGDSNWSCSLIVLYAYIPIVTIVTS